MDTFKEFIKRFIHFDSTQEPLLPTDTSSSTQLPQRLTHKLYLDIRQNDTPTKNYLEFIQKTYYQHLKDSLNRSWICTKASFYFFFQAFFPNSFQHYGPDVVIYLSETILDEYALIFEAQAQVQAQDQVQVQVQNCTRNSRCFN
jgi:hypothetical protein